MTYDELQAQSEARDPELAKKNRAFHEFMKFVEERKEMALQADRAKRESERRKQNFRKALDNRILPVVKRNLPTLTSEELHNAF